jgi:hypothetical protein
MRTDGQTGMTKLIFPLSKFFANAPRETRNSTNDYFYPQKYRHLKSKFRDATLDDFDKLRLLNE